MDRNTVQLLEEDTEENPVVGQQYLSIRLPAELMWNMALFCSQNKPLAPV